MLFKCIKPITVINLLNPDMFPHISMSVVMKGLRQCGSDFLPSLAPVASSQW